MNEMKAMEFRGSGGSLALHPVTRPIPQPAAGELLIRICAAGVTPSERSWYPTNHSLDGTPRQSTIPGHEFSGVVESVGSGVASYRVGDAVFGMNDWFADGATAQFCIARPEDIALKPSALSHVQAASVPIGVLTSLQGLETRAKVQRGERVLVHGGAGAVGLYAVQLAKLEGAYVIATASAANLEFVSALGADVVIDYRAERFEDRVESVDVVFDTVGGDTLDRSWKVLSESGRLLTIAADAENSEDQRIKKSFFIVEPNGKQLASMAELFDSGKLRAFVKAEVSLDRANEAYSGTVSGMQPTGKIVIRSS